MKRNGVRWDLRSRSSLIEVSTAFGVDVYSYLTFSLKPLFFVSTFYLFSLGFISSLASLPCSHHKVKEMAEFNREEYFAANNIESTSVGKKYGGLVPKKKPLISKDNERAFFDSADWALCKVFFNFKLNSKTYNKIHFLIWIYNLLEFNLYSKVLE
ncbi:cAMP-regulated phosphoprotein-like protein [Medicago truncatula]|uniref:cAMP-regulated phosphoprotein-like protein n=1 Tax=Medicago truncatula TaxID=3880 RepID=A0A072VG56_MEDTR|nr:cAMP-regulated phosphoprotein-like protein [Medicago truncatula]